MTEQILQSDLMALITNCGDLGLFIAMFLESSVLPIPSEVIIIGAGTLGISLFSIMVFGSLGATLGASVGYFLGRYAAMPMILKLGKFILLKPHHIYKAEAFAKKYGVWGVLAGRLLPIVPFKVFSIASGITKVKFIPFIIFTMIGVLPRIYLLTVFGRAIVKYTKPAVIIIFFVLLLFLAFKLTRVMYNNKLQNKKIE